MLSRERRNYALPTAGEQHSLASDLGCMLGQQRLVVMQGPNDAVKKVAGALAAVQLALLPLTGMQL
jgi:hypothetical protein